MNRHSLGNRFLAMVTAAIMISSTVLISLTMLMFLMVVCIAELIHDKPITFITGTAVIAYMLR